MSSNDTSTQATAEELWSIYMNNTDFLWREFETNKSATDTIKTDHWPKIEVHTNLNVVKSGTVILRGHNRLST